MEAPVNGARRRIRVATFAALVLVALAAAAVATAGDDGPGATVSRYERIDPATIGLNDGSGAAFVPAAMSDKQVSVVLRMAGDPVAVAEADAKARGAKLSAADKAAIRADLKSKQDAILKSASQAGATVIGQMQDAYNGILVHAAQKDLAALSALPGVTGIQPVGIYAEPANVNGVPLLNAPAAWGRTTSLTGAGVKIGIIDTGIDYTHADFGGPGTAAAWNAASAASTAPANPSWFGPAAPKVKGGFDFVGNAYNARTPGSTPAPDPNPLDCNGHGTHVSGSAAGFGVTAAGATYSGPYNATTVSGNSWLVGPGVAPRADLYMYRVFGCSGSTDVVIQAINKAVQDGVNVISMSLGAPFGTSDQNDAELTAVNNAVAAGITVVAAAGNNGQNAYIVSSPGSADHALSVAAIDGSVPTYPGGHFQLNASTAIDAINANGASFSDPLTGQVKVLHDSTGGVSLGCDPAEYAGSTGKIVVVQRGVCARVARAIFGQKAGAAAVVMINNSASLPPFEGQITSNPDTGEQYTVTIPFFGVKGTVTGADATKLLAADGTTISITNTTVPNSNYKLSASFTAGGPRQGDSAAKPEVTAPGVSVTSALAGGGTKGTVMSGTSMATPMASGTAALVKQAHPGWSGDQIKAALVNTADPGGIIGYNSRLNGSGFLQADKATDTDAIAWTADGLDSLSYGYAPGTGDWSSTKSFTVSNLGASPISYNLAVTQPAGATLAASPMSFTVPAGGTQVVNVTASITTAQFAALPGASSFTTGVGQVVTRRGAVTAAPTTTGPGIQSLRVPALIAPRGLSSVQASAPAPYQRDGVNNVYRSSITVSNSGIHSGTADVYAWGIHDPADLAPGSLQDVRDVGVQSFNDGTIVFAVNGWNQSSTQATQEYDIAIDLQNDGKPDYFVVGADLGAVLTGTFDGRFGSFTFNAKTGALVDAFFADAPMNGSTALLPTTMDDLGLHAPNATDFRYSVQSFSIFGGSVDATSVGEYDVAKPGVSTGQFETLAPGSSVSIPLSLDFDQTRVLNELGWLVVSPDDAKGASQADEVPFGSIK